MCQRVIKIDSDLKKQQVLEKLSLTTKEYLILFDQNIIAKLME